MITSSGCVGREFLPQEKHLLSIIKSLQDELLRVSAERDYLARLLQDCEHQIYRIVDSHLSQRRPGSNSSSSSSSEPPA